MLLGSWSTSSSPVRSPSPNNQKRGSNGIRYGTTSLQQRSRSPSPSKSRDNHFRGNKHKMKRKASSNGSDSSLISFIITFLDYHQNYQMLQARRGRGRILPPTPNQPSDILYPGQSPRVSTESVIHPFL